MPTWKEKYNHESMTVEEIEERAAADLIELHDRYKGTNAEKVGQLFYSLMCQLREGFRTAQRVMELK